LPVVIDDGLQQHLPSTKLALPDIVHAVTDSERRNNCGVNKTFALTKSISLLLQSIKIANIRNRRRSSEKSLSDIAQKSNVVLGGILEQCDRRNVRNTELLQGSRMPLLICD